MNLFATPMLSADPSRVTTCENKRVAWNAGLAGLNHPVCKLTDEHKAKLKGRVPYNKGKCHLSDEAKQRISLARKGLKGVTGLYTRDDANKTKLSIASSVPVMTPDGVFPSKGAAAEFYGIHRNNFSIRMKKHPEQYYALVECNKKGNTTNGSNRKGGRK